MIKIQTSDLLLAERNEMPSNLFIDKIFNLADKVNLTQNIKTTVGYVKLTIYIFEDGSKIATDGNDFLSLPSFKNFVDDIAVPDNEDLN